MSQTDNIDPEGEQATTSTTVQALRPDTEGHDLTVKVSTPDSPVSLCSEKVVLKSELTAEF